MKKYEFRYQLAKEKIDEQRMAMDLFLKKSKGVYKFIDARRP
ncbi:unnamed protein product [Paramecium sonneborni]|uniref:Uncharacterized protein n=1 Tax=Paramecium sonneborni TaxID=65129 RepID=A0A8S1NCM3_9CILI|nr:unnamed protein product [Paramecium sonneborni]